MNRLRRLIAGTVEVATLHRVRALWPMYTAPSLRLWWTPWTYRFGHDGWVWLHPSWFKRFWNAKRPKRRPE